MNRHSIYRQTAILDPEPTLKCTKQNFQIDKEMAERGQPVVKMSLFV